VRVPATVPVIPSGPAAERMWDVIGVTPIVFIQFGAATGGVSSFSAGTTGLTPNTATTGNVTLDGTLAIANGGTGAITAPNALTNLAAAGTGISNTFTANQIVSVTDNTNAALRITQLGSGNALLVEDSTNPDASPFVIDANGSVVSGHTTFDSMWYTSSNTPQVIQVASVATGNRQGFASVSYTGAGGFSMFRANGGVIGTEGAVVNGDATGIITFAGYDGATSGAVPTAFIQSNVDGVPGVGDMPGRLTFHTTADGASTPTERMRIDSAGQVGIPSVVAGVNLRVSKNLTGATSTFGVVSSGITQSDSTAEARMYSATGSTAASAFSLNILYGYLATQGTIGAGSIVNTNYGFHAGTSLTGATSNFGFYSNIAAPTTGITTTGTISTISSSGTTVTVSHNAITYTNGQTVTIAATANATALVSGATATILTVGTTDYTLIGAASNTVGVSFTATGAGTGDGTVRLNVQGSGKTVAGAASGSFTYTTTTSQTFAAVTVLTGTVTVSTRYNLYMSGTADNYFAGNVLQGHTSAISTATASTIVTPNFEVIGSSLNASAGGIYRYSASNGAGRLVFSKSRTNTIGAQAVAVSGDDVGVISYSASDGTQFIEAARIAASVDGIPGTNNMPGRLVFSTTADGASSPTERMRIANTGAIGLSGANYGTAGQVLTSAGSGASPTWSGISGGTF